jgi:hypothetical protein
MLRYERTKRAVRQALAAEDRLQLPIPPVLSLTERFAHVRPAVEYRIDNWLVKGGRALLVAQHKTGKTTLTTNCVRSLVDDQPFLGVFKVRAAASVVMLDFEMTDTQIEAWLKEQNIRNTDAVHLVTLRGGGSAFDMLDPERRREWAATLRAKQPEVLFADCLRPILDSANLDEHSEAGRWLVAFDELLKEANIPEAVLVHHSGHGGERSRGDSRILDWPDCIWSLMRQDRNDPTSKRFIKAHGRDVDVDEGELQFDPHTRHLTYMVKSRKEAGADDVLFDVLRCVAEATAPMSIRNVQAALKGHHSKGEIEAALKQATGRGNLTLVIGRESAHLHSITAGGRLTLECFAPNSGKEIRK